jgi:molybdopterin converting factor small subunit
MSIAVVLTYDMSKALGLRRLEVDDAPTVQDVVRMVADRLREHGESSEKLARVAAVAVNGVLINHRQGVKTRLSDGDTVAFLRAAAGG